MATSTGARPTATSFHPPNYESKLWNLVSQLTIGNISGAVSYQAVIGDAYQVAWSDNDPTTFVTWNSVMHLDFNRKNEKSWQGQLNYSFDDKTLDRPEPFRALCEW